MEMAIQNNFNKSDNNELFIKDIGEASAIHLNNIKLLRIEKDPSGFYWFVFPCGKSNEISNAYWSEELTVIAKRFNDSLKSLKDRLYSQKGYRQ